MSADYWRVYYGKQDAEQSDRIREEFLVRSTGVDLHIDVYPHPNAYAPVVVLNHGAAGYCRLFVRLAGPKRYLELPFGHWSNQPRFWEMLVQACDEWFREHGAHGARE
jgi:hypothetical protein